MAGIKFGRLLEKQQFSDMFLIALLVSTRSLDIHAKQASKRGEHVHVYKDHKNVFLCDPCYSTRQNEVRGEDRTRTETDSDRTGPDFTPLSPFLSGGLVPDHVRTWTVPE